MKTAFYNTRETPHDDEALGCIGDTRLQILAELEAWAVDADGPRICWLNGMAGTGKTSIAHTFSKRLDEEKQILGATFFCSHSASPEVRDASRIISTIAYKLSQSSPLIRSAVCQVLEEEPDVGSLHTLSEQFASLVVKPIQTILDPSIKTYKVVVIDALDECTKPGTVAQLIQSIVTLSWKIPVKFFISSRDTSGIRQAFQCDPLYRAPKVISLHDVERIVVQGDIKLYLQNAFSAIAKRRPELTSWPPPRELESLLEQSDRLFIYAATAVRYIGAPGALDCRKRLTNMAYVKQSSKMQTGGLDSLYNEIMRQAFHELEPDEVSLRRDTLSAAVFLLTPLSIGAIAALMDMYNYQVRAALASFSSVIHVPAADNHPVSIFHASFRDFIIEQSRCKEHFLDTPKGHQSLAAQCLWYLNTSLHCNSFNLESNTVLSESHEFTANQEALRYSSLHWASHLVEALKKPSTQSVMIQVKVLSVFIDHHLLHWFECLSVLRQLESGVKSLDRASEAISVSTESVNNNVVANYFFRAVQRFTVNLTGYPHSSRTPVESSKLLLN